MTFKLKVIQKICNIYILETDNKKYLVVLKNESYLNKKDKVDIAISKAIHDFDSTQKYDVNLTQQTIHDVDSTQKKNLTIDDKMKIENNDYNDKVFKNQIIEYKKTHAKTQTFINFLLHDFPENFSKDKDISHSTELKLYIDNRFTGDEYKRKKEIYDSTNETEIYKIFPIEILTDPNEFLLVETYPVRYNDNQLFIYKEYYKYYKNLYNSITNTIKIEKYNDILDVSSLKPLNKVDTKVKIDGIIYRTLLNSPYYIYQSGIIKYTGEDGNCISKGTWSGEPVINFYQCINNGLSTYRFGTNITITQNIDNDGFNHYMNNNNGKQKIINKIRKFENNNKKIIVISLLGICNENINCFLANTFSGISKKVKVSLIEPSIVNYELQDSDDITFISLPLSSNTKLNIVKLFDYDKWKEQIKKNDLTKDFYNIINLNDDESTFKSIVDIAFLYYSKYKDSYILSYHCKSGKDRTSLFDCIIQSSFYYIENVIDKNENEKYETIRKLSTKFLLFGFLIAFYGTGFLGLKLDSNKSFSTYLLGSDLYNFYYANANMSGSSG